MMIDLIWIVFALLLVLMNAFFVAAEFGMVKLRHTKVKAIKERYGLRGRILVSIHEHLDAYLSACQLGITLASLGLGWIGEPAFAHLLERLFLVLGTVSPEFIKVISFIVAFSFISFLHIVIGELMPKSIAIRQSEKVSVWTAVPLYVFYWLMYPAIWFLNGCSNFLLKIAKLNKVHRGEHFHSTEEIKFILSASHLHGELTKEEAEIIEHTLDFADLNVTEVMRPKEEMVMLNVDEPLEILLQQVLKYRYSRYPIFDAKKNEVIGIVHVKDLFAAVYQKQQVTNIQTLMRPVLKVSHHLLALNLLQQFKEGMPHFALVYHRANLLGFVTLDNLLHVMIGRIKDEFHKTQNDWRVNKDGSISLRGDASIFALEQALGQDIEVSEPEINTVGGLIMYHLDALPLEGQRVQFKRFLVIIEKMSNTRIDQLRIYPTQLDEKSG